MTETFISNEILAMEAIGHTIFPIALHRGEAPYQPEAAAIADRTLYFSPIGSADAHRLIRRYIMRMPRITKFTLQQTTEPHFSLAVHSAYLADYIQNNGCSHIHAHFAWGAATYAIAAAKLLGLPVTFTCHGSDVYARPSDLALKCRSASAVFGISPAMTGDLQAIAPRTPCHTVQCGVDTERFKPRGGEQGENGKWLFVGRLIDCKGIGDILAAWAKIPQQGRPRLDIVGEGPLLETLQAFTRKHMLEDEITFLGMRPSSWIAENGPFYKAFIAAFKKGMDRSKDSAPVALKEAMAMGLPVVTTRFRDIPGIVNEDNGILCPVSSPDALAAAVRRLESQPAGILRDMGMKGRAIIEAHYSLRAQALRMGMLLGRYKKS